MRYTTVIDISEIPAIYRSQNARLTYVHLALRCGYHDTDRDIADVSVRRLALEVGVSVSAVRHALHLLERFKLIEKQGNVWMVKKWIQPETITPRKQAEKALKQAERAKEREKERQSMDSQRAREDEERAAMERQHLSHFIVYYESLYERVAAGDVQAPKLLVRHRAMYLSECERVGRTPLKIE